MKDQPRDAAIHRVSDTPAEPQCEHSLSLTEDYKGPTAACPIHSASDTQPVVPERIFINAENDYKYGQWTREQCTKGDLEYILRSTHEKQVAELKTYLERATDTRRDLQRTIRSWQQHAERTARTLGCIAIDTEIEVQLDAIVTQVAELKEALRVAANELEHLYAFAITHGIPEAAVPPHAAARTALKGEGK